jgi:hypothetical protein
MIICIVENSNEWDDFGQPYLIDTSLLKEEYLRAYLESTIDDIIIINDTHHLGCIHELDYSFASKYADDIQQAIVQPPQMVDKLISIIFE